MCGIFGVVVKKDCILNPVEIGKITNKLFLLSESRGKEASGFAIINDTEIIVHKTPESASRLLKTKVYHDNFDTLFSLDNSTKAFMGHSRLVTDGYEQQSQNNQPVIKNDSVLVHNGIIVNKCSLWEKYKHIGRDSELDSELLPVILHEKLSNKKSEAQAIRDLYSEIHGMTNIAIKLSEYNNIFLATNNGSLYYIFDLDRTILLFASERFILNKIVGGIEKKINIDYKEIAQLKPKSSLSVDLTTLKPSLVDLRENSTNFSNVRLSTSKKDIIEITYENYGQYINTSLEHSDFVVDSEINDKYNARRNLINSIQRCKKCLLPVTFPSISFSNEGICSVCAGYSKIIVKGEDNLINDIEPFIKNNKGHYDCLVAFSGGRDSSYLLYYLKEILGINPIAFSYDWGMLTDLARRNQSRVCGTLGIEHILISADIRKKRRNISLNVSAWLKRPSLGTIPLFMAGDKQYFYYASQLMKQNNIGLSIMGENHLEKTGFKIAFSGAKQSQAGFMSYHVSVINKMRMMQYYLKQYILNPAFINKSLIDTLGAYISYYGLPHDYINLYDYIPWEEKTIDDILIKYFDWETDPGTTTTWRIGDGTVAFYNYIYYMVAGFTENDTFRSNQIREGKLTREKALKKVLEENKPRWDSIKWYCDTIQIDVDETINRINSIPTLF